MMKRDWWKIREVLLRARGKEPLDGLPEWAIDACDARGWIAMHYREDEAVFFLTEDGWDAAGYMSDDGAFERAFQEHHWRGFEEVTLPALPPDIPWPILRDRLADERGWT